jgi:hypothetical protein
MVFIITVLLSGRAVIKANDPDHPGIVQIGARLAEGHVPVLSDPDTGDMYASALLDEPGIFLGNFPGSPFQSFKKMDLFRLYMVKKMRLQVNLESIRMVPGEIHVIIQMEAGHPGPVDVSFP